MLRVANGSWIRSVKKGTGPTGTGPNRYGALTHTRAGAGPAPVRPRTRRTRTFCSPAGPTGTGGPAYGYGAAPYPQSALVSTFYGQNNVVITTILLRYHLHVQHR